LTLDVVESALGDFLPRGIRLQPEEIVEAVAADYKITLEQMLGRNRAREVALPRQIAMFLLREELNLSLPQIGQALGGRDHTTVMYGSDKINDLIEQDERLRKRVSRIREKLYGRVKVAG
jgi:chromosomal replication initiator protein